MVTYVEHDIQTKSALTHVSTMVLVFTKNNLTLKTNLIRVWRDYLQCTLLQQDCGKVMTSFDEFVQSCDSLVWQCCSQPCDKVVENKWNENWIPQWILALVCYVAYTN